MDSDPDPCADELAEGLLRASSDHGGSVTVIAVMLTQLAAMEKRLMDRIAESESVRRERWRIHDSQHVEWERALEAIKERVDRHLADEEREDLVYQARLGPAKTALRWMSREWRTIAIVVLIIFNFVAQLWDRAAYLGQ